jgi:cell division protein ZapA (FtsZ GTPase activity inhibitor)
MVFLMAKYTITIADIDLNISTEESPEMVDRLVGILDRRIRELLTRMPRLSKSEATILCAVDFCAQSIKSDEKTREMEHDFIKISKELEVLREENATLLTSADDLRRENRVMHEIITKSVSSAFPAIAKPIEGEQLTIKTEPDEPNTSSEGQPIPAAKVMFEDEPVAAEAVASPANIDPDIIDIPERKVRRRTKPNPNGTKNKVGDMFDMLTFKDV